MWLAIEGVVGAGKTTTSSLVGELAGMEATLERLEEHPLLEAYYRDPARYALETELVFMAIQVRQVREALPAKRLITDFAPAKNLIFARLATRGEDFRLLEVADARLWADLPQPDLTVILDVPLDVCRARVRARGRLYEQGLNIEDLARIREGYLDGFDTLGAHVERLELSGSEKPTEVARTVLQISGLNDETDTAPAA
jgi:deoxyguanosine kinase